MQAQKIRMILTGGLAGKTIMLRKRQFVDGIFEGVVPATDVLGLKKYFTAGYQVKFEILSPETQEEPKEEVVEIPVEEKEDNVAIGVDDSDVLSDEEIKDKEEDINVDAPNNRQQEIIAAVNEIDKEKWIEQDTNPHPKVVDVAGIMDDPTVTKDEIVEVIEKWLS